MSKRRYTQVQMLLPEVKRLKEEGKTYCEIAEESGLTYRAAVINPLHRKRIKERRIEQGIYSRPKDNPQKESPV